MKYSIEVPTDRPGNARGRRTRQHFNTIRIVIALVALFGIASVGLAACGTTPSENTAARIVPADAQGFATVALSPSVKQKTALFRLSSHFPETGQSKDEDDVANDLLDDLVKEWDLDYGQDVKPWLGGEAAIAIMKSTDTQTTPITVALIKVKNQKKAKAVFERKQVDNKQYRFIDDYVALVEENAKERSPEKLFDAMEAVQQGDAPSLNDEAKYKDALESMNGEHLALGWVDVPSMIDALDPDTTEAPFVEDIAVEVKKLGTVAFNLYATDSSLVMEAVSEHESSIKRSVTTSDILRRLPPNTLMAAGINDISGFLAEQVDQLERKEEERVAPNGDVSQLEPSRRGLLQPMKNFVETLDGEMVATVAGDSPDNLAVAVIAHSSDIAETKKGAGWTADAIRSSGAYNVTERTLDGTTGYVIETKPEYATGTAGDRFVIAFGDHEIILANTEAYALELAANLRLPGDDDVMEHATTRPSNAVAFIDVATVARLGMEQQDLLDVGPGVTPKTDEERRDDEDAKAWARSLEVLSGHVWTENGREHAELRLTFK